jgi:hypothetical protein
MHHLTLAEKILENALLMEENTLKNKLLKRFQLFLFMEIVIKDLEIRQLEISLKLDLEDLQHIYQLLDGQKNNFIQQHGELPIQPE